MDEYLYSPRDKFLNNLGKWEFSIPLQAQWAIKIIPDNPNVAAFLSTIGTQYTPVDYGNFEIPSNITDMLFSPDAQSESHGLGLHFAQGVTVPDEGFSPTNTGIQDAGGYLRGAVGGDRKGMGEKTFSMNLLETNLDFCDGIIRPWIIAASYLGLIDLGATNSIKSTVYIQQFTRGSLAGNAKPMRKIHTFRGCVPFEIDGSRLDYTTEDNVTIRDTQWMFNHHTYVLNRL